MKKKLNYMLVGAFIGSLYMVVFGMSYSDAITEQDVYCNMVNEGSWPNYQDIDCN